MYPYDDSTGASVRPTATSAGTARWQQDGDAQTGVLGSIIRADFLNDIWGNLAAVLTAGGVTPVKGEAGDSNLLDAIKAIGGAQRVSSKSANYTALIGDNNVVLRFTSAATLSFSAASGLGNGWNCRVRNDSSGWVTLDPNSSETIDGNATASIPPGGGCIVVCDGTGFLSFCHKSATIADASITGTPTSYDVSFPNAVLPYISGFEVIVSGIYLSSTDNLLLQVGAGTDGSPTWATSGYAGNLVNSYASGGSGDDNTVTALSSGFTVGAASGSGRLRGAVKLTKLSSDLWVASGIISQATGNNTILGDVTLSSSSRLRLITSGSNTITGGRLIVRTLV